LLAPASVLLASSEDSGVDAGRLLKEKLAAVGGRGGGSPRLAQGSVPDAGAVESVVASLVNRDG
jgi:alanyl-tRNA synthetase